MVNLPCELENIRKWFLLGLNIGKWSSDVLKIDPQNLRQVNSGGMYLDLIQNKDALVNLFMKQAEVIW